MHAKDVNLWSPDGNINIMAITSIPDPVRTHFHTSETLLSESIIMCDLSKYTPSNLEY